MPRTYSELYISVRNALRDAGVEAANVEARLIVASASGKTTAKLLQDMRLYATDAVEKKAAEKKAPAKRTAAKTVKTALYVQYEGKEVSEKDLIAAAKKAYTKLGNKASDIKSLDIYVKPEEGVAYYVVNGTGSDDYKIEL